MLQASKGMYAWQCFSCKSPSGSHGVSYCHGICILQLLTHPAVYHYKSCRVLRQQLTSTSTSNRGSRDDDDEWQPMPEVLLSHEYSHPKGPEILQRKPLFKENSPNILGSSVRVPYTCEFICSLLH